MAKAIQLSISLCRNSVELGNICSWRTRYVGGRGRCLPLRSAPFSPPFNPLFLFLSPLLYFFPFSSSELIISFLFSFFLITIFITGHNFIRRKQRLKKNIDLFDSIRSSIPFEIVSSVTVDHHAMRRCILRFAFQPEFNDVERGGFQHADS